MKFYSYFDPSTGRMIYLRSKRKAIDEAREVAKTDALRTPVGKTVRLEVYENDVCDDHGRITKDIILAILNQRGFVSASRVIRTFILHGVIE